MTTQTSARATMCCCQRSTRQRGVTLVELLIGMTIATLLSGMVLIGWFSLQDSYSSSVKSNKAREYARDGMSRMVREIRDARARSTVLYAVTLAEPTRLAVTTSFNDAKAATDVATQMLDYSPRLVTYTYDSSTSTLYRAVAGGERQPLVTNVTNGDATPLFTYTYVSQATGELVTSTSVPSIIDKAAIQSVRIHLLVDLNPGHSPVPMDLVSTAQLRNMRKL